MALKSMKADAARFDPISLEAAMRAGKKIPPDAIELLILDHREVMALFNAYEDLRDTAAKARLAKRICMDLKAHMQAEEEIFYPAARVATDDDATADQAAEQHAEAKNLIAEIEARQPSGEYDELIEELRQAIEDHVSMEETKFFPEMRKTGADLYAIGVQVVAARARAFSALTGKPIPPTLAS